ncbi:tetratricopeptide repeat protein [Streptomyces sp. NPDC058718]|uniref:tetratricopeptide repeat protein n=1 Tax=Streptomyces sp. NPDC058718 TaxID=3346610 RepID=UPI0036889C3F
MIMVDALTALRERLRAAHLASGELSTREIARRAHGAVSHTAAHQVLRAANLPSWKTLEPVVAALGGDAEKFKELWMRARSEQEGRENGTETRSRYQESVSPGLAAQLNLFRKYLAAQEIEKAKGFAAACLDSQTHPDVDLIVEVYDNIYYRDGKFVKNLIPWIDNFIMSGDPAEIETARVAHVLARKCLEGANPGRALSFTQRAIVLNPYRYGSLSIHSEALMALGLYGEAEEFAVVAYRLDPSPDHFIYTPYADLLIVKRNFEKLEQLAKTSYEEAGGLGGDEVSSFARCLMICGKPDAAASILQEKLALEDSRVYRVDFLILLADALWQMGDRQAARRALRNDPLYEEEKNLQLKNGNLMAISGGEDREASIKILEELLNSKGSPD